MLYSVRVPTVRALKVNSIMASSAANGGNNSVDDDVSGGIGMVAVSGHGVAEWRPPSALSKKNKNKNQKNKKQNNKTKQSATSGSSGRSHGYVVRVPSHSLSLEAEGSDDDDNDLLPPQRGACSNTRSKRVAIGVCVLLAVTAAVAVAMATFMSSQRSAAAFKVPHTMLASFKINAVSPGDQPITGTVHKTQDSR